MSENGSSVAINALSKSKARYQHQDQLLLGFMRLPESTAKEVAVECFDWCYEKYADSPKRAHDLASEKLGYLTLVGNRQCRRSGKVAHVYRITPKGVEHLRKVGLLGVSLPAVVVPDALPAKQGRFSGLRSVLA